MHTVRKHHGFLLVLPNFLEVAPNFVVGVPVQSQLFNFPDAWLGRLECEFLKACGPDAFTRFGSVRRLINVFDVITQQRSHRQALGEGILLFFLLGFVNRC